MKTILSVLFVCSVLISTAGNAVENKVESNTTESSSIMIFSGTIVDAGSKESLAGVKVSVSSTGVVAFTNLEGKFNVELPANSKERVIKVSYISYEETTVEINGENEQLIEINQVQ